MAQRRSNLASLMCRRWKSRSEVDFKSKAEARVVHEWYVAQDVLQARRHCPEFDLCSIIRPERQDLDTTLLYPGVFWNRRQ